MSSSDIVQLFSLPMEVIGFTITFTEVLTETKKKKFDARVNQLISNTNGLWRKYNNMMASGLFIVSLVSVIFVIVVASIPKLKSNHFIYSTILTTTLFCFFYCISVFRVLKIFLPDRPTLALGLILSSLGVIGETYQVAQINF